MDDLLIVRMSDRSKERYSRKRRKMNAPIGMNFGLIVGIGAGTVIASKLGANPAMSLGIGVAFGVLFGAVAGRFFKPLRRYERSGPSYSYEGMPFEDEEKEDPSPDNESVAKQS